MVEKLLTSINQSYNLEQSSHRLSMILLIKPLRLHLRGRSKKDLINELFKCLIVHSIVNKSCLILFGIITWLVGFGIILYLLLFLLFLSFFCRSLKLALRPCTFGATFFLSLFGSSWGLLFRSNRFEISTSFLSFFIECLLNLGLLLSFRRLFFFFVFVNLFRLLLVLDPLFQNLLLLVFAFKFYSFC